MSLCDEGNVSIMLDLHLMGQSKEVNQQKVIVTWSKKVEKNYPAWYCLVLP